MTLSSQPNTYVAERMALERIFMQGEEPMW